LKTLLGSAMPHAQTVDKANKVSGRFLHGI